MRLDCINVSRYGCNQKLIRTTALALHFVSNLQVKKKKKNMDLSFVKDSDEVIELLR